MAKQYRVKPIFDHLNSYSIYYVIQKRGIWFGWTTISPATADKNQAIKDCDDAQELYDKYGE